MPQSVAAPVTDPNVQGAGARYRFQEPSRLGARQAQGSPAESAKEPVRDPSQLKKIQEIRPFRVDQGPGQLPEEVTFTDKPYEMRTFAESSYMWAASDLYYNPLYFEDVPLERYGHTNHPLLQPIVSIGKFSGQLALLPYQMTLDPIRKQVYPLGYYRPGEWHQPKLYQIPFNAEAAVVEGAVITGLIFLIP